MCVCVCVFYVCMSGFGGEIWKTRWACSFIRMSMCSCVCTVGYLFGAGLFDRICEFIAIHSIFYIAHIYFLDDDICDGTRKNSVCTSDVFLAAPNLYNVSLAFAVCFYYHCTHMQEYIRKWAHTHTRTHWQRETSNIHTHIMILFYVRWRSSLNDGFWIFLGHRMIIIVQ